MTSREQFEKWFEGMFCVDDVRFKYMAEIAWQASRAAIEIKLPETDIGYGMMEYYEPQQVIEAIESAGLKVKK